MAGRVGPAESRWWKRSRAGYPQPWRGEAPMAHIGVLTAGGDCPGLNAAIRGVVARATAAGAQVSGIEDGWQGLMEGRTRPLTRHDVRGSLTRGGARVGAFPP